MYQLLALDQLLSLAVACGLSVSDPQQQRELEQILIRATKILTPEMSGLGLSPELGYPALLEKNDQTGPIFCLERRMIEADPYTIPLLVQRWNVETIRNNYAVAKLELYYNPREEEAVTKQQMVAEIFDYCTQQGIDFLLEVIVVVEAKEQQYQQLFKEQQLGAVQDLRRYCHVMALEFPFDAFGAVTVTAELDIPWILSARDTEYNVFKENLRTALESGAKGYLAAEQFFPIANKKAQYDRAAIERFIMTEGRDRAIELGRIVQESA